MIYAYIDDSKTHGESPVFALGGYLAASEQWAAFSEDWYRHLQMDPRIDYFKLWEALNRRGEFDGRDEALCQERIVLMRQVIEKHLNAHFFMAFRVEDYLRGFAINAMDPAFKNPYFFGAGRLTLDIARNLDKFGFERGPVDFVFDSQVMEKSKLIDGWEWANNFAKPDPPDLLAEVILVPPYFQDDEHVLPLQAADMHVTWERMNFERQLQGCHGRACLVRSAQFSACIRRGRKSNSESRRG